MNGRVIRVVPKKSIQYATADLPIEVQDRTFECDGAAPHLGDIIFGCRYTCPKRYFKGNAVVWST